MSKLYVRASLTPKARIKYDLMTGNLAHETGGASNSEDLSLPRKTEMSISTSDITGISRSLNGNYIPYNPLQYRLGDNVIGLSTMQAAAGSRTYYEEQESEDWMGRTSLTDGLLFSERNLDGLQTEYSTIYDAVQKYGGWDAARNALPADVKDAFSGISTFLYDWGEEMAEFLLTKAPFPPHIKTAIAVGFFMKAVYDIVEEVCKKREARINEIKAQNPDWEQWKPWELEEKANESLDAWVIQAVGEKAIGEMLRETTKAFELNGVAQTALSMAWNRFVAEAKAGRWERRTQ